MGESFQTVGSQSEKKRRTKIIEEKWVKMNSVQFSCSVVSNSLRPHEIAARQASLSITNSQSSLKLTSIESVMPSSHLILCRPLLLLTPILPSIRVFPMSQLFAWGDQSIGVSALALVFPKNTQDWSPLPCHALKPEVLKVRAWTEYSL